MTEPRPAPPVTIVGGPAAASIPDLPTGAPDEPVDPRRRRRGRLVPGLLGLALLAGLGVAELRERAAADEAARAQEQRDRSAVDLVVAGWSDASRYEPQTDEVSYEVRVRVRNDGPRAVDLLAVESPRVQLLAPATLDVGKEAGLALNGQHPCRDDLAALLRMDRLPLVVRTEAGTRRVDLDFGGPLLFEEAVRRACDVPRPGSS